jgi:phosphoribosylformimino-5-aminoimidazole carboxamide ribotide isomerase
MLICPAIDLLGGRCVRLKQGRFDDANVYSDDPFAQLDLFVQAGVEWIHVVDLDGARAGAPRQHDLIAHLATSHSVRIQAGGGIRRREDVGALLDNGVARVVVGSAAVSASALVRNWLAEFGPEQICLAFDVRPSGASCNVAMQGWQNLSDLSLREALSRYPQECLRHLLVTDISRDGMMSGPNVDLFRELCRARPDLAVQASGGIASLEDLAAVKEAGAAAAIVGRAFYERRLLLREALDAC